jgi:hypothetical protein
MRICHPFTEPQRFHCMFTRICPSPILNHTNPHQALPTSIFEIHFNIIPQVVTSFQGCLTKSLVGTFHLYRYATCTAQLMPILNLFLFHDTNDQNNREMCTYLIYSKILMRKLYYRTTGRYTYHIPEYMRIQSLCRHMSSYVRCDVTARSWKPSCNHWSHLLIMKCR